MFTVSLYVPVADNDGNPVPHVHEHVRATLAETFGGFTAYEAVGGWYAAEAEHPGTEAVTRYDVLTDAENSATVRGLAEYVKREAAQDAVLVTVTPTRYTFH